MSNCKIEMEYLNENEDGSIDVLINIDAESTKHLITYGFIHMLKEAIEDGKINTIEKSGCTD